METQRVLLVLPALLTVMAVAAPQAAQAPGSSPPRERPGTDATVVGRIVAIHAPRLFTVRERDVDREIPVIAPRALPPVSVGARVAFGGVLFQFGEAELKQASDTASIDERTRRSFVGRLVLVAHSAIIVEEREPPAAAPEAPPFPPQPRIVADRDEQPFEMKPLTVRAAMLSAHLNEFAGRPLRVTQGRVVGVFQPSAFLIEPATPYLKAMGLRDRVLVLIESASLRVPAELIVGSTVTVTGIARTLIGIQVTREVPWPPELRPEAVERLEICGALLASSVQTPEGTELTDRQPATIR
jgi:hypothetical protein